MPLNIMRQQTMRSNETGFTTLEITLAIAFSAVAGLLMVLFFQKTNTLHHKMMMNLEKDVETFRIRSLIRNQSVQDIDARDERKIIIRYNYIQRDTFQIFLNRSSISRNRKMIRFRHHHPMAFRLIEGRENRLILHCKENEMSWILERNPF